MSTKPSWHHLPLAPSADVPILLTSMDFGASSYTIQITDMANIWTESLDRKAICIRAWGEDTSIDPSDTAENMDKFLSSLKSALDSSHPGHDQTSLALMSAKFDDAGENGLTLRIVCNIPGLQPLRWPVHLKKGPPAAIATDLVLPLIQAHYGRRQEVESLVQAISYKDAVISKLVDKLEAVGTGLEHVFTALSGRKKVSRSAAQDRVKGLAPFDRKTWKAGLEKVQDVPTDAAELARSVFEGDGLPSRSYIELDTSANLESWWQDVKTQPSIPIREQPSHKTSSEKASTKPAAHPNESMEVDDDDFQVQSTPPRLKVNNNNKTHLEEKDPLPDDASTQDEEDATASESEAPIVSQKTSHKISREVPVSKSRLGTIGGAKPAPVARSPPPANKAEPIQDDSETASEAEDDYNKDNNVDQDATASIPEDSPSPLPRRAAPATAPKKCGLGKIGGKKTEPVKARSPEPENEERDNPASQVVTTPKKLGRIGRAASSTSPNSKRGRQATTQSDLDTEKEQQKRRETSQERANRRREELKRELEKKAAAGPAKKKRRF